MRSRLNIDTTFIDSKGAGIATKYLNSGEITVRDGIEVAISCVFTPLGLASQGGTIEEVERLIEISRTQFETYMSLAVCRAKKQVVVEKEPVLKAESIPEENILLELESIGGGINLDEEEF